MYSPRPISFPAHWCAAYSKYRGFLAGGISNASSPLLFWDRGSAAKTLISQYRQLRRLTIYRRLCLLQARLANVQDCEQLQKDIDHLTSWAKKWYMPFEPSKCKIMHITRKTTHKITYQYTMEHTSLDSVQYTKYLGVTTSDDLR